MTRLTNVRDLPMLAREIIRTNQLAEDSKNKAVFHAIECGAALIEAKALCKHGEWLGWLRSNCSVSERTTQVYMKLANEYPLLENSNTQRVADLSIRVALNLLSAPKEKLEAGEPITDAETKELKATDWLPKGEKVASVDFGDDEYLLIQESSEHQGFYYAAYVAYAGSYIDFSIRPINPTHLAKVISDWLPGRYTNNVEVKNLAWLIVDSKPDYVFNAFINPFLPDSHAHLRRA